LTAASAEILDLDEEKYRVGEWAVRLTGSAVTVQEPNYVQCAKALVSEVGDAEAKSAIADYLLEEIAAEPDRLFILGPGSTVQTVAEQVGVSKTLLGVDALTGGKLVGRDISEQELLALLAAHPDAELVLSPIGAQGFVLGRGNLQLSPTVVRKIGRDHITVLATPAKLKRTPVLRFDTGDATLDTDLVGCRFLSVITGYRRRRLVPVAA
jgi:predicted polyphosphate/ATP-dependent NAD kinase